MYCKNCGKELANGAEVCAFCGVTAGNGMKYCADCGTKIENGKCPKCSEKPAPEKTIKTPQPEKAVEKAAAPVRKAPSEVKTEVKAAPKKAEPKGLDKFLSIFRKK